MALVFDDRYQPREESAEALQRLFDVCFDSADAFSLSRAAWARQDHTLERETSALGSVDGRSVLFQKRNASARNGLT